MSYELVLGFDTDSAEFARGVEVGRLWERLHAEPLPLTCTVHADNAEMALRLAEAVGVSAQAEELSDEWLSVTFLSSAWPGSDSR